MEMENKKKCSNKKHSEINAISYCSECNLFLCNKCLNIHIEYLETHHIKNIDTKNQEIFTGFCQEKNHKNDLIFYCKNHNKLCCAACLCKIKEDGNGLHHDCNVCSIKEIKEEKINKLSENIKYLEESEKNIEESINKLKNIFEKMNKSKEDMKNKIAKIFTKLRNLINEREEQLLSELDIIYEESFFKEDIIKKGEKIPNQIKTLLEKGNLINKEWDDNVLIERINDCINIENSIKNIFEINENIKNYNSKIFEINFKPEDELTPEILEIVKNFGELLFNETFNLKFKFKPGKNYEITKNGLLATKNSGGNNFNCAIIGDKEIPKNKTSKWKIKMNKIKNPSFGIDVLIGIGPSKFKEKDFYNECWCILTGSQNKVGLKIKGKTLDYNNHKEKLKEGDIIEVIVDRGKGNLSFAVNDINFGIACSNIPKDEELYPTIILYEQGQNIEIV